MFDVRKEYEEYAAPLVAKLIRECNSRRIPVFVAAAVKDDGRHTEYERDVVTATGCGLRIAEDRFPKFLNTLAGIPDHYMEEEELEINFEPLTAEWAADPDKE